MVIVFSGKDISSVTNSFEKSLNIELKYSSLASQLSQKSMGIKMLGSSHEWVLFLDDDVVLENDTLERLFIEYLTNVIYEEFVGFGLSISNRSTRKMNSAILQFLKLFNLHSDAPGTITKSGHAQSYLDHPNEIEVQWLNGISVWKSKVLSHYPEIQTNQPYSAYEDVDFSYKVSKNNKLLFARKAIVINQKIEGNSPLSVSQFVYGGFLRYKFVFTNTELSKRRLLAAQLVRGLDFIFRSNKSCRIIDRMKSSLDLWLNILVLVIKNKNIDESLLTHEITTIK